MVLFKIDETLYEIYLVIILFFRLCICIAWYWKKEFIADMDLNEDIEEFYDCAEICGCGDYDHNYVSGF